MLNWIKIRNLALIEEAEIAFTPGFNAITGETGAGKTVLMSALGLLLGERADKSLIRNEAKSCEICALLSPGKKIFTEICEILESAGVSLPYEGEEILVKRIITANSSRNFINDNPCSLQLLKNLGDILIDTHGPHEHQSLLKPAVQLQLLDQFAGAEKEKTKCRTAYDALRDAEKDLSDLMERLPDESGIPALRGILSEIQVANLTPKEDEDLSKRHNLASKSHDIISFSSAATKIIEDEEGSITDKVAELFRTIREIERLDPENGGIFMKECEKIKMMSSELSSSLRNYCEKIELDEREFSILEERMKLVQNLKRHYGPSLDDVLKKAEDAELRIQDFENAGTLIETLKKKISDRADDLGKTCATLSVKRKSASAKFAQKVREELKKLGFLKSGFSVKFGECSPGTGGSDTVEFLFSANPGEGEKALREIASSGEISRVMLALKTVLAASDSVPVLVFDEIDVNIGGITATTVGKELGKLGETHQVLCITHLPQVAAMADNHLKVDKEVSGGRTFTSIVALDGKGRVKEIARMLGGSVAAEKHAEELDRLRREK